MRGRSTLLLVALLVLLCGGYWGMQHWRTRQVRQAQEAKKLFAFEPAAIASLTVAQINAESVTAVRDAGGPWRITAPNATIVPFQLMWDRVAQHLAALANERTVADKPRDLKQYGMEPPSLVIQVQAEGQPPVKIEFGEVEPTQRFRYARFNGGYLFLVSTNEYFELNRSLLDLRHRFVVDDRDANINQFEFAWIWNEDAMKTTNMPPEKAPQLGEESVVIKVKRDDPHSPWKMLSPVESPANQEAVDAFLKQIQFDAGQAFVDKPENLADYGLKPPRARISIVDDRSGKVQNILVGALDKTGKGGLYVKRDNQDAVFEIDAQVWTLLPTKPLEWRERRLLTRRVSDISRIEYRAKTDSFTLVKDGKGNWKLESPAFDDVNQFTVSGYLAVFKEVAVSDILTGTPEQYGLDNPDSTIDLKYDDGSTAQIRVTQAKDDAEKWYATQDSGGIGTLRGIAATALLTDSDNFRSRELVRFNKAEAVKLEFQMEKLGIVLEKRDGQWAVVAPANLRLANQSDADTIIDAFNPLKATRVETDKQPESVQKYGLAQPLFTLYVTTRQEGAAEGSRIGPIQVGSVVPDSTQERYAMVAGKVGVFRVQQKIIESVREALRGFEQTGENSPPPK